MSQEGKFAIYPSLAGRVVVITGGAMGIGACMVEHFAQQGSQVIFLDILDEVALKLVEKISGAGVTHTPIFHHCDVTDIKGGLQPVASKILSSFPKVHVLINSAAGTPGKTQNQTMNITVEVWDQQIAVNLRHHFFLTQALMPGLLASGSASVINMGSISWAIPATGVLPYITSKAAVVGLTRTLAHEFGPQGIRVNSIMPGSIGTEREKRDVLTPEYKALVLGRQAIKELLQPAHVARLALWLASDDSNGMTNQSIAMDGGWT
ncbi:hypothetical protein BGZ63DRAFT_377634 [Mariannaea sp. PMI_226]|nr:hypothetical protein BGZ63DRAFT_377634 [Mariannaea sp. PMI_226]